MKHIHAVTDPCSIFILYLFQTQHRLNDARALRERRRTENYSTYFNVHHSAAPENLSVLIGSEADKYDK